MKYFTYIIIPILLSCSLTKKSSKFLTEDNHQVERLKKLSKVIESQRDNTYNVRQDRISLPERYDTITWSNEMGEKWKGRELDIAHNKYFLYGKMLDSLLLDPSIKLSVPEIIAHYGRESSKSTYKGEYITGLLYYFNNSNHPNCSCRNSKNDTFGSNCSMIEFEFDKKGYLKGINKIFFSP